MPCIVLKGSIIHSLHTNLQFATKARKSVENSRLMLDSTKAAKKSAVQGRGMNPDDETHLSEEARAEIEAAEDEFVNQTEEAVGMMKNVGRTRQVMLLRLLTSDPGARHPRAFAQPGRPDRCSTGVSQEGLRNPERAWARRGWTSG